MARIASVEKILSNNGQTKVSFYFSRKSAGDEFDQYEKNYTDVFQNPISRKMYVSQFTPEALAWRELGLKATQGKLILCDSKYENWFRYATKIVIDGIEYSSFPTGGGKVQITERPNNFIRVIVFRV